MNFFTEGSQIGLSIDSWYAVLLVVYFIFEIVFIRSTKMFLLHKLLILPVIIWQVKKMTPKHWKPKNFRHFFLINRVSRFKYEFYCEFKCKLKIEFDTPLLINPLFTNDEIIINPFGKIVKSNFVELIKKKDNLFLDKVKQFNREQSLKDLGI